MSTDLRCLFRRARGALGRRGWEWVCYSHPVTLHAFFGDNPIVDRIRALLGQQPHPASEQRVRHALLEHIRTDHADITVYEVE
jgi:hypothetical protein